jgi:DNA-binding transcriptional MerR regulator/effector-binding domain-containing protein
MKVETQRMLSIGRLARLSGLTVKALRHYDEVGVLRPAHVDEWTGYRWYERAQVREAVAVRRLRELRVPLDEVTVLVRSDDASLREALAVHRARLEGELVETRQVLTELDRLIEGREHLVTELTLDLRLVDEPAGRYAVVRDRVRVDDMFTHVPETIMRVCGWLQEHGIQPDGEPLTIFLGNGIDEWLDVEVGAPIGKAKLEPADDVIVRELPATRAAEHLHRGPYDELPALYGALETAIRERGLVPEDLAREHYLVSPSTVEDPAGYETRIVWPVAR